MDRRVFQPRPDNSAERRRNALSLAILVLLAGGLWLYYTTHPAPRPSAPSRPVAPAAERSIPHA